MNHLPAEHLPAGHLLASVTAPLVTAFDERGRPDPEGVDPLLAHVAAGGVRTVMLFGSNGEGAAVDAAEITPYAGRVRDSWRGRAGAESRVLVAVSGPATRQTLVRAEAALAAGADALVVNAPYYFRHDDAELLAHFTRVDALGAPWVAYNIPRYTGNPLGPELMARLAELPHCAGVKDSGGDPAVLAAFVALGAGREGFAVSQGAESALVAGLRAGAAGITPGLANLAPAACTGLAAAVASGDQATADRLQAYLNALGAIHTVRPGVPAMKAALAVRGLLAPGFAAPAAPFRPYSPAETSRLTALLAELDPR